MDGARERRPRRERHAVLYRGDIAIKTVARQRLAKGLLPYCRYRLRAGLVRTIAPFDGVIETLYVELGDNMQPGRPLLTFSETNIFQAHADIPVRLRRVLSNGMLLPVRLDVGGPSIPARIRIYRCRSRPSPTSTSSSKPSN